MELRVEGAEQFGILARALKEAGDTDLRKELFAGINRSVKPLSQDVKSSLGEYLPGGYADDFSKGLRISARSRSGGRNPGVRMVGKRKSSHVGPLDQGRLRHPLFGNKRFWFDQRVKPGFFTEPLEQGADKVRNELLDVLRDVANKLVRKVG